MPMTPNTNQTEVLTISSLRELIGEALMNVTALSELDDAIRLIEERRTYMTKITIKKGDKVSLREGNTAAALRPYIGKVYEVMEVNQNGQCIINIKNQNILCSPHTLVLVDNKP